MAKLADEIREKIFKRVQAGDPPDVIADDICDEYGISPKQVIASIPSIAGHHTQGHTPRVRSKKEGHVYFIQGEITKNIKIGFSDDPKIRIKGHQTGSGEKLDLLKAVKGCKADETEIHNKFKHLKIRGEWFRPEKELFEYIETCKDFSD
jgi:hypothetical protein